MKLLLLGGNGQIGWELRRSLAVLGEVIAPDSSRADLRQHEALVALAREERPDVVVNAAAYTAVDRAESEPDLARAVNATAVDVLAREAAALGAWLVHYSSDYVFDGSGSAPRAEDAPTGPLNVYGRTKLEGEELIRASGCRHLILRTSWVYSARGSNFAKTMLELAAERETLRVIDDQVGAPTGAELLADVTAHALRAAQARPRLGGTYHVAAAGETSWHGYARFVLGRAWGRGVALKASPEATVAVPSSAYPTAAARPRNSRLDVRKLQASFGLAMPPWQQGVARMLDELLVGSGDAFASRC
jgi:dTDP-4-dehydrorhamnose reductase